MLSALQLIIACNAEVIWEYPLGSVINNGISVLDSDGNGMFNNIGSGGNGKCPQGRDYCLQVSGYLVCLLSMPLTAAYTNLQLTTSTRATSMNSNGDQCSLQYSVNGADGTYTSFQVHQSAVDETSTLYPMWDADVQGIYLKVAALGTADCFYNDFVLEGDIAATTLPTSAPTLEPTLVHLRLHTSRSPSQAPSVNSEFEVSLLIYFEYQLRVNISAIQLDAYFEHLLNTSVSNYVALEDACIYLLDRDAVRADPAQAGLHLQRAAHPAGDLHVGAHGQNQAALQEDV